MIIYDRGAEIFCNAFVGLGQFDKFYGGFGKRGEHDGGTPVSELPADILHHLRVVPAYGGELRVEVGQPDVEVRGGLVDLHYLQRPAENGREDELGPGLRTGIRVEPLEFDVLPFVQAEPVIIGMKFGFILRLAPASSRLGEGDILRFLCLLDSCHIASVSLRLSFREQNK